MAEGRVKDPHGNQGEFTWGFIQRTNNLSEIEFDNKGNPKNINWPDSLTPKVIPFYNDGSFHYGDLVSFDVVKEDLSDPQLGPAKIAIATNVQLIP